LRGAVLFLLALMAGFYASAAGETTNAVAPVTARDFYNAGTELLAAKKYADAERMFQSSLAEQDEHIQPVALYNLGYARFADGLELLKKGPDAQKLSPRGNVALATGDQVLHAGESALAENNLEKMISAYIDGKRMRHELRNTEKIVQAAIDAYGKVLAEWQRAADDFSSAKELNSGNPTTDPVIADEKASLSKRFVEQEIAKLIDQLRRMQEMLGAMGKQRQDLGKMLSKLKGQIPAPDAPPGGQGDDDDEDDGSGMQPDSLRGKEENAGRDGQQMQIPLSPDQASQILNGIPLDGSRRLPMTDQQGAKSKDKNGRNW
jgi:tetratricopeptide (TPR) repeat protein